MLDDSVLIACLQKALAAENSGDLNPWPLTLPTRQQFYTDNFATLVPPVGELTRSA